MLLYISVLLYAIEMWCFGWTKSMW